MPTYAIAFIGFMAGLLTMTIVNFYKYVIKIMNS
jgi:hypothetical protein